MTVLRTTHISFVGYLAWSYTAWECIYTPFYCIKDSWATYRWAGWDWCVMGGNSIGGEI